MMNRKTIITSLLLVMVLASSLTGCYYDKSTRNIEYAPNMYNSLPLEPYSQTEYWNTDIGGNFPAAGAGLDTIAVYSNRQSAQPAPAGTMPRTESWYTPEAYDPYDLPATAEAYEAAASITSPINQPGLNSEGINCTEKSFNHGKELYERFCVMCHGASGNGQGSLVTKGALGGVPSYSGPQLAGLPVGKMYHTLTHGKGLMGSYASQLTPNERWEVICYIQQWFDAPAAAPATASATTAP